MKKEKVKKHFLEHLPAQDQILALFDHIPHIHYFVKDNTGQFILGNKNFIYQCGAENENDIIGHGDFDFFPNNLANDYVVDDRYVFKTGHKIMNKMEMTFNSKRQLTWFITSKVPLKDTRGNIIGLAGTAREVINKDDEHEVTPISGVLNYLHKNYCQPVNIETIAGNHGMSLSTLERNFKKYLRTTPLKYINHLRILDACRRLTETSCTIARIAAETGFYDHSAFHRYFRKQTGLTPGEYRKKNGTVI